MSELFVLKNTGIVLFKSPSLHVCLDAGWTSSILKQIERRYYVLSRRYEFYVRVPRRTKLACEILGSLTNSNGNGCENITKNIMLHYFKLYGGYSILFSSSNVGNFSWSRILKDCTYQSSGREKYVCCLHVFHKM